MTLSDLRLGVRMLRRRPVVAIGAILSLALGIGANTAIFSVLHRVVLSPLPYHAPDDLTVVWETSAENDERWVAPANFMDWRRETTSFASLAAFDDFRPTLLLSEPEVVRAVSASGNYFSILGATAAVGRTLVPEDETPAAPAVAVLSDSLWQRAFSGSQDAIGRTVTLDGRSYTIVGIMPAAFEAPLQTGPIDLWVSGDRGVPRTFPFGGDVTAVRDSHIITVIGRLRTGVSREVAQQELTLLMQQLAQRHPDTNTGLGANVKPLHAQVVGDVSRLVILLQVAVALMLLIACANVAHLLLGQAVTRRTEMATRVALGAGRSRLVRQLFVETLVIAIPGGFFGLLLANLGLNLLVSAAPQGLPRVNEIAIDQTVLFFTLLVTMTTAMVFGLGPSWQLSRDTGIAQSQSTTRVSGARGVRRWHHAIVIVELAGAHVLLIGAALLVNSLLAAQAVPLGFTTEGRVAADLNLAPDRYLLRTGDTGTIDVTAKLQFVDRVLSRVRQSPGVRFASASFTSPLTGAPNRGIAIEGRPNNNQATGDNADFQVITPDFFRTVGATLLRGRHFADTDTADTPSVVIVNQALVDTYFGTQHPIGRRIRFGGHLDHEIVGVVSDMRYRGVESPADPTFYLPITQNVERWPFLSFAVWTEGDERAALAALRAAIREADPNQPVVRIRSFDEIVSTATAARRFNTTLVSAFAITALLLAAIGTYGVMAFSVSVRTRELGVRAALGATPGGLTRLVLRGGVMVTAVAVALGLLGSLLGARVLRTMLFGVTPHDPATFATVAASLFIVALVAVWVPTRRVIASDPVRSLRDQ
jgi:putative ABC transport system permease protein